MSKFQVGDRVRVINTQDYNQGEGEIVEIMDTPRKIWNISVKLSDGHIAGFGEYELERIPVDHHKELWEAWLAGVNNIYEDEGFDPVNEDTEPIIRRRFDKWLRETGRV